MNEFLIKIKKFHHFLVGLDIDFFFVLLLFLSFYFNSQIEDLLFPFNLFFILILTLFILIAIFLFLDFLFIFFYFILQHLIS
jgi:hypothetical protein